MKHIGLIIRPALALLLLLPAACTNDDLAPQGGYGVDGNKLSLQLEPAHMGVYKASRASDAKEGAEQEIKNAHIFIFDSDGNYLLPSGSDAFQGYDYITDKRIFAFASDLYGDQTAAKTATVVAVANVPADEFGEITGGRPQNIANLSQLEQHVFTLEPFTVGLPETGLPMVCIEENVDLSSDADSKIKILNLRSMMARIDFNFTMEPFEESATGNNPSFAIQEIHVGGFPTGGTIKPQLTDTDSISEGIATTGTPAEPIKVEASTLLHQTVRKNTPQSGTFYVFEHGRAAKDYTYPDSITGTEIQRLKNERAVDDAAFIRFTGTYTNHNDYPYNVEYTIYPGGDPNWNFTLKTNCQYKNNVTITGITVNNLNPDQGALLDTRVNIDTDVNPYFIEMLRERKHDAHFNVTPMDVYIDRQVSPTGTVTISIDNADENDWIRMEPMRYSSTAEGRVFATNSGDGKRLYFTQDLLTELDKQEGSKSYTVGTKGEAEERIYFYIDENVPKDDGSNQDSNGNVLERSATLTVTFDPDPATVGGENSRSILIKQAGMLRVEYPEDSYNKIPEYEFYIEYYEEYLEHYDGKDKYTQTYNGLEWGLMGLRTYLGTKEGNEYMPYGWRNTMTIMQQFRNNTTEGKAKPEMTLNDTPRSATEYCYNKNKRNKNNRVETCHWYHPTIRELEYAMDKYYGTFVEFQDNWYWSSNPGPYGAEDNSGETSTTNLTWTGEAKEYARATKSLYQGVNAKPQFSHATSEANKPYAKNANGSWDTPYKPEEWGNKYPSIGVTEEGEGGFARRNKVFRIRAAYIKERPSNVPSLDNSTYYR